MSKWHKIKFFDLEYTQFHEIVGEILFSYYDRVKCSNIISCDIETFPGGSSFTTSILWCIKFKDETDAMAFKLEYL